MMKQSMMLCVLLVGFTAAPAFASQDAGPDAGTNPFLSRDLGCSTDADCPEGDACNQFGECEFFDAVGDMGLGGGGGGDAGSDTGVGMAGADTGGKVDIDEEGCSTTGSTPGSSAALFVLGLLALRRRRR